VTGISRDLPCPDASDSDKRCDENSVITLSSSLNNCHSDRRRDAYYKAVETVRVISGDITLASPYIDRRAALGAIGPLPRPVKTVEPGQCIRLTRFL